MITNPEDIKEIQSLWRSVAIGVATNRAPFAAHLPAVAADEVVADYVQRFKPTTPEPEAPAEKPSARYHKHNPDLSDPEVKAAYDKEMAELKKLHTPASESLAELAGKHGFSVRIGGNDKGVWFISLRRGHNTRKQITAKSYPEAEKEARRFLNDQSGKGVWFTKAEEQSRQKRSLWPLEDPIDRTRLLDELDMYNTENPDGDVDMDLVKDIIMGMRSLK